MSDTDMQYRLEQAKPKGSLLHHLAANAQGRTVTVCRTDGQRSDGQLETAYTDGLSLIIAGMRTYFPLNSITSIQVHNP
jgi:hypothetical protein